MYSNCILEQYALASGRATGMDDPQIENGLYPGVGMQTKGMGVSDKGGWAIHGPTWRLPGDPSLQSRVQDTAPGDLVKWQGPISKKVKK